MDQHTRKALHVLCVMNDIDWSDVDFNNDEWHNDYSFNNLDEYKDWLLYFMLDCREARQSIANTTSRNKKRLWYSIDEFLKEHING